MGKSYSNPNVNPNVVGTGEVIDNSLTGADIGAGAISASELADNAVDNAAVQDDSITAGKIAAGAVGTSELGAGSVGTSDIADGAVTAAKLAAGAAAANVADGSVTTAKLADDAVTAAKIADGAVGADQIAAGAVGADEIATGAVGADEIAANAVGASELADNAVDTAAIADGAVTTNELADASVTAAKLASGASAQALTDTLPGTPFDGQLIHYQTSAMRTAGMQPLQLRYNATSAYNAKWDVIGGGEWAVSSAQITGITATSYATPATRPSMPIPLNMVAHVSVSGAVGGNVVAKQTYMTPDGAGLTAATDRAIHAAMVTAGITAACTRRTPLCVLTAGTLSVAVCVDGGGVTGNVAAPGLFVQPVRVGGAPAS